MRPLPARDLTPRGSRGRLRCGWSTPRLGPQRPGRRHRRHGPSGRRPQSPLPPGPRRAVPDPPGAGRRPPRTAGRSATRIRGRAPFRTAVATLPRTGAAHPRPTRGCDDPGAPLRPLPSCPTAAPRDAAGSTRADPPAGARTARRRAPPSRPAPPTGRPPRQSRCPAHPDRPDPADRPAPRPAAPARVGDDAPARGRGGVRRPRLGIARRPRCPSGKPRPAREPWGVDDGHPAAGPAQQSPTPGCGQRPGPAAGALLASTRGRAHRCRGGRRRPGGLGRCP